MKPVLPANRNPMGETSERCILTNRDSDVQKKTRPAYLSILITNQLSNAVFKTCKRVFLTL